MAPEAHWAQVLPDPDLGSNKVTYPHYIGGAQQLCVIHLPPNELLRLQNPTGPPFDPLGPCGQGWGCSTSPISY